MLFTVRTMAAACGQPAPRKRRQRLPLGEAGIGIGSSEPIPMTDEGRPAPHYLGYVGEIGFGLTLIRLFQFALPWANWKIHLPPGEGFGTINNNLSYYIAFCGKILLKFLRDWFCDAGAAGFVQAASHVLPRFVGKFSPADDVLAKFVTKGIHCFVQL